MSDDLPADATGEPAPARQRGASHWRSRARQHPLPEDHAARQGRVSHAAFVALGREQALAFLNSHNEKLGGQPLAIATASASGETIVNEEIDRLMDEAGGASAAAPASKDAR